MANVFGTGLEVLHNLDYDAISVTVDASTAGTVTENGRKILKAGTILKGVDGSIFSDRDQLATQTTGASGDVDGILLSDIDLTDGNATAALVYRGTVRADRLPAGNAPANVQTKLKHIQFVNGI